MSEQTSTEPKFYKGGKSKAMRALKSFGEQAVAQADKLLFQNAESGEWGFYPEDAEKAASAPQQSPASDPQPQQQAQGDLEQHAPEDNTDESEAQDQPNTGDDGKSAFLFRMETTSANVIGNAAHQLASSPQTPQQPAPRAASRTSYTIEKNRPEQNGIKRPSAGGLCRAVWDACDDLRAQLNGGDAEGPLFPDSKQIKALAESKGWNRNNATIEFYQWRKYNGVTGRSAKQQPAPEPKAGASAE